jgi:HK97 family phage portal protein
MNILDRFFGSRKFSESRSVSSVQYLNQAAPSAANFATYSKEGYEKVVMVYRCVSMIAEACGGIEWELYSKRKGGEKTEIENHELLDLLEKPNPLMGRSQFIEALVSFYLIAGNSYVEANKPSPNKPPKELWPIFGPDKMKVIVGKDGYPSAYEFRDGGNKRTWPVDFVKLTSDVLHLKTFNPTNIWYGLSPLQVGIQAIDNTNASATWNLSLLRNMATPSGVLTVESTQHNPAGALTIEQRENLKESIEERYSGVRNAGRPMLLEGGLKWQSMSLTPKDMDYLKGKEVTANDICLIYGVPGELVGLGQKTFNNYEQAKAALYTETILPLMDFLKTELNRWLVPAYGEDLCLEYDKDDIEALTYIRQAKFTSLSNVSFLTFNEKRKASGYEELPGWDVFVVGNQLGAMPEDFSGGGEALPGQAPNDPNAPTPPNEDPNKVPPKDPKKPNPDDNALNGGQGEDDTEDEKSVLNFKSINLINSAEKRKSWKRQNQLRQQRQAGFQRDLKSDFNALAADLKHVVHSHHNIHTLEIALLQAAEKHKHPMTATIEKHIRYTVEDFGLNILANAKSEFPGLVETKSQRYFQSFVDLFVKQRTSQAMTQIQSTTTKKVHEISRRLVSGAIEDGETNAELADKFIDQFDSLSESRARTIARTEVSIASNTGAREAVKSLDVPGLEKEWVTANDDRVRDGDKGHADHLSMNGESVPLDGYFNVPPDAKMDGPGDESADAEQVINCRCVLVYSQRGNNNGNNDDGEE